MRPFIFAAHFPSKAANYGGALAAIKKLLPGHELLGPLGGDAYFAGFVADEPPSAGQIRAALGDSRAEFVILPLEAGAPWVASDGGRSHDWLKRHLSPPRRP